MASCLFTSVYSVHLHRFACPRHTAYKVLARQNICGDYSRTASTWSSCTTAALLGTYIDSSFKYRLPFTTNDNHTTTRMAV